jgi:hypothetical protein
MTITRRVANTRQSTATFKKCFCIKPVGEHTARILPVFFNVADDASTLTAAQVTIDLLTTRAHIHVRGCDQYFHAVTALPARFLQLFPLGVILVLPCLEKTVGSKRSINFAVNSAAQHYRPRHHMAKGQGLTEGPQ